MRVVEITQPGPPDVLKIAERPDPIPAAGEVLIDVAAAGVNRPDVLQRLGKYPPPPGASDIPGLEVAGSVAALGDGVTGFAIGDRVCALVAGGGYAERAAVPHEQVPADPEGLDGDPGRRHSRNVLHGMDQRLPARPAESRRVDPDSRRHERHRHDRDSAGARVWRARVDHRRQRREVRGGASSSAPRTPSTTAPPTGWRRRRRATDGRGVDVILDIVGGDYIGRNLDLLAVEGRLLQIAFLKSAKAELDFSVMMRKRAWITGSTLRPRTPAEKGVIARDLREHVWPLLEQGMVAPVIHETFPLAQASAAHRLMETSSHIGKLILDVRRP